MVFRQAPFQPVVEAVLLEAQEGEPREPLRSLKQSRGWRRNSLRTLLFGRFQGCLNLEFLFGENADLVR